MSAARTTLVLALAAALTAGCVPAPKRSYTVDQIPQIDDLEEVMRVQAHAIDRWMAKEKQASYSDEEFRGMGQAARVVEAAAASLRDRFARGRTRQWGFHAARLLGGAKKLQEAAQARAAPAASSSLYAIRRACKSCHSEYK